MAKFEQLEIWKESLIFAKKIFTFTSHLERSLQYSLGDQLRRSSLSISSNIAEGSGSDSIKEELRYINIAIKSSYETLSQLYFCKELGINIDTVKIEDMTILIKRIRSYRRQKHNQLL